MKKLLVGLLALGSISGFANIECVNKLVNLGYGADYAAKSCRGVSSIECVNKLVNLGYGADYAAKSCRGI